MAEPTDQIRNVLEKIRDDAQKALTLLGGSEDQRALSWKCAACGHVKHFTRPVPAEVASPCPKCGGELFRTNSPKSLFCESRLRISNQIVFSSEGEIPERIMLYRKAENYAS